MPMRHIEVIVDQWPIGSRSEVMRKGQRVMIDETAAFVLVGMGKCAYVADDEPQRPAKRRYNRRDMRAGD